MACLVVCLLQRRMKIRVGHPGWMVAEICGSTPVAPRLIRCVAVVVVFAVG